MRPGPRRLLEQRRSAWPGPAKVFFEQGRLAELNGDGDGAAERYRRAYAVYPHPEVDAGAALRRLGLAP